MPECWHDDTLELEHDDDGTTYKCDLCGDTWFEPYE